MEPPLGSGPYKVGKFEQGRFQEFERVKDWWGEKLPVMRGQNNFDVLHYDYFRDRDTAFEGFTAKSYTFREEFTSRVWRGSEELSRTIFAVAWYVLGSSSETSSTTAVSGRTIKAISSLLRRSASR